MGLVRVCILSVLVLYLQHSTYILLWRHRFESVRMYVNGTCTAHLNVQRPGKVRLIAPEAGLRYECVPPKLYLRLRVVYTTGRRRRML
jgi:hypothetical protein